MTICYVRASNPNWPVISMRVLFLALLLATPGAYAADISIVGNASAPPKIFLDQQRPNGILVDILNYAAQQMPDQRFDLKLYPWARAYQTASSGQAGIIGLSRNDDRQKLFDFSVPIYEDEIIIVVRRDHAFPFKSIADFKGRRIGMVLGGSFGQDFEQGITDGSFSVDEDNGPDVRLRKLLAGRIDAALINPGRGALARVLEMDPELLKHAGDFEVLPTPFKRDPNYLGFPKSLDMTATLKQFDAVIEEGYRNGDIPRIIQRYERLPAVTSAP